jgi:ubiquinone/menaquinone biosynthesis C-methylase UbiE
MPETAPPSPDLFFDTVTAYQKTAALKAALDLGIFTVLVDKPMSAKQIAQKTTASERGVRILCDYMTVQGFLTKSGDVYSVTRDSAFFLNRNSPAYAGGAVEFLLCPELRNAFEALPEAARRGGAAHSEQGTIAADHPVWITFARAMGGLMVPAAYGLADILAAEGPVSKILDIAAGHGVWGIAQAKKHPAAQLVALDWENVLKVAAENAGAAAIMDRFSTIAGNAFEVDLGANYDLILVPNFLHHFSATDCVKFLKRAHGALRKGGRLAIVEFVPNADRVTPPPSAGFALVMLATTPQGDAYTFDEYARMLAEAGFVRPDLRALPASANQVILASKN